MWSRLRVPLALLCAFVLGPAALVAAVSSCPVGSFVSSVTNATGSFVLASQNATTSALAAVLNTTNASAVSVTLCNGCVAQILGGGAVIRARRGVTSLTAQSPCHVSRAATARS